MNNVVMISPVLDPAIYDAAALRDALATLLAVGGDVRGDIVSGEAAPQVQVSGGDAEACRTFLLNVLTVATERCLETRLG